MNWSVEETMLALTALAFAVIVIVALRGHIALSAKMRVAFSGTAAAFLAAAVALALQDSASYPPFMWLLPLVPCVIFVALVRESQVPVETPVPMVTRSSLTARVTAQPVGAAAAGERAVSARAADPSTDAQELARIAYTRSDLRSVVAANPAATPGLLDWLSAQGDVAVHVAIAGRSFKEAPTH